MAKRWTLQTRPDSCPGLSLDMRGLGMLRLAVWITMSAGGVLSVPRELVLGAGALVLCAPPCSSWCRVSRGTTMRSMLNPMGIAYPFVAEANMVISRRYI